MLKAYLGSTNKVKIEAVKSILAPLGYEVIGLPSESHVSSQPKTDQETMKGALNRTQGLPLDGLRFGLEAGVELHGELLFLVNWGVLLDERGNVFWAGGTRIPLPEVIKHAIFEEHLELSDAMEAYFSKKDIKHQEGAIGYFTNNYVCRIDIFTHIVRLLYGQYQKKKCEKEDSCK